MANIDNMLKSILGKKHNLNINKIISTKKRGGLTDLDGDGVKNWKDCQPFNTMRQYDKNWYLVKLSGGGHTITYANSSSDARKKVYPNMEIKSINKISEDEARRIIINKQGFTSKDAEEFMIDIKSK